MFLNLGRDPQPRDVPTPPVTGAPRYGRYHGPGDGNVATHIAPSGVKTPKWFVVWFSHWVLVFPSNDGGAVDQGKGPGIFHAQQCKEQVRSNPGQEGGPGRCL